MNSRTERSTLRRWYGLIVTAVLLFGCSENLRNSVHATVELGVPQELIRALEVPDSTLHIALYRDDTGEKLTETAVTLVDGASVIDSFQVNLPLGEYSVFLRYFLTSDAFAKTIVGETGAVPIVMADGNGNRFDFSNATLLTPPDNDDDGHSNLAELRARSNPDDSRSTPPLIDKSLTFEVTGLNNERLDINSNTSNLLQFNQDGTTSHGVKLNQDGNFSLAVTQQPLSRHCRIANPEGDMNTTIPIRVHCTELIELTVQVSPFKGTGLALISNAEETLSIPRNGAFSFQQRMRPGPYSVSIKTQPSNPAQKCTVTDGSGNVDTEPITNISVTCRDVANNDITVSGNARGLRGLLQLHLVKLSDESVLDSIAVYANGSFSKSIAADTADFSLRINTSPPGQHCGIGTKQVIPDTHTGYIVECASIVVRTPSAGKNLHVRWTPVTGAANYAIDYCVSNVCGSTDPLTDTPEYRATAPAGEGLYRIRVKANFDSGAIIASNWTAIAVGPWSANDSVLALAANRDGSLYVGGSFSQLLVYTGAALVVPQAGHDKLSVIPKLRGLVFAATPDSIGGWYIGGSFAVLGEGINTSNLVHVNADGNIDRNFLPRLNGTVKTILRNETSLYVGGDFTEIGSEKITNLAALDDRGNILETWSRGLAPTCLPTPPGGGSCGVDTLILHADVLYFGGRFTHVNGTIQRNYLAAATALGGELIDAWAPSANARVHTLAQSGGLIYAGGDFYEVSQKPRQALAAINLEGQVTDWIGNMIGPASTGSRVHALAVSEGTLYVGGGFNEVNTVETPSALRRRLAAFDLATGKLKNWVVNVGVLSCCAQIGDVRSLSAASGIVYVGGDFTTVNNETRIRVAAIDEESQTLLPWTMELDRTPHALTSDVKGERLFVGGEFQGLGAHNRPYLASIMPDGNISDWSPSPNSGVTKLAIHNDTLYALGRFSRIGVPAQQRGSGAAFDLGSLREWNPQLASKNGDAIPHDLAFDASAVYISGIFDSAAQQEHVGLVATDPVSGAPLAGQLNAQVLNGNPPAVWALALSDNGILFTGGGFGGIGPVASAYLARIDTVTRTPFD